MSNDAAVVVVVDEWSGKYVINDEYRPLANNLIRKYETLKHIPVGSILFLENTDSKGKNKNKVKYAQINKMPDKWQQIIKQLTGRYFGYYMEIYKRNTEKMSREQVIAAIYHELRHIGRDGEIIHHDIEDWADMYYHLGHDWATTKRVIPNLLDEGVNWDSIMVPRLFYEPWQKQVM